MRRMPSLQLTPLTDRFVARRSAPQSRTLDSYVCILSQADREPGCRKGFTKMLRSRFHRGQRATTLSKAMLGRRSGRAFRKTAEQQMLSVASQLFNCLHILHEDREVCHLGVTPEGISFQTMLVEPWDQVALISSGSEKDVMQEVKPLLQRGPDSEATPATKEYASSEQLRSLQHQMQGDNHHRDVLIDGRASDIFSTGVVLYEMLVGQLPFDCTQSRHLKNDMAPASVKAREWVDRWEQNGAMLSAQDEWRNAVFSAQWEAQQTGQPLNVQHPLMHQVRMHSANPELAANFFLRILHPVASLRLELPCCYRHPYLASAVRDLSTRPACQQGGKLLSDVSVAYKEQCCLSGFPLCTMGQRQQSSRCSREAVSRDGVTSSNPGHLQAATAGGSLTDSVSNSSNEWEVRQRLNSLMNETSLQASDTSPSSHLQQEDVQQLQQQQEDVQLVAEPSDASTAGVQLQVLPGSSSRKQRFSMLSGVFRRKKFGEQAECAKGGVEESQVDPAGVHLIAAVRAPSSVEPQAKASGNITASGGAGCHDQSKEGIKHKLAGLLSLLKL